MTKHKVQIAKFNSELDFEKWKSSGEVNKRHSQFVNPTDMFFVRKTLMGGYTITDSLGIDIAPDLLMSFTEEESSHIQVYDICTPINKEQNDLKIELKNKIDNADQMLYKLDSAMKNLKEIF